MNKIIRLVALVVAVVCLSFLAFQGYELWQKHQKNKQLFVYLQKESPITRKMPPDAHIYINLYDFNRVYTELQSSHLYDVFAHWLDTGMAENNKANPLMGGMLEKTILNVIGDEFGITLLPAPENKIAFLAIARLQSASDFILKLVLSQTKKTKRIDFKEDTIYVFSTKNVDYPEIAVFVHDDFAYASNNIERLKRAVDEKANGPAFLKDLEVRALPENTFLFVESKAPQLSAAGFGANGMYHLKLLSQPAVKGAIPQFPSDDSTVLTIRTNGTRLFNQPPVAYAIKVKQDQPASGLLLRFASERHAAAYHDLLINYYNQSNSGEFAQPIAHRGFNCFRYFDKKMEATVCTRNEFVVVTSGEFPINNRILKNQPKGEQPLTMEVALQQQTLQQYKEMVERQDWSRFEHASIFYFLSCIKNIAGNIDSDSDEITIELM